MEKIIRTQPIGRDKANRSTDYQLLPVNPTPPAILQQPFAGFTQTSWKNNQEEYKVATPVDGVIKMVEGTEFSIVVIAADPSNLQNINDDSNLRYVWKRDGTPIYEVNSLNNDKGIRGINISKQASKKELSGTYTVEITNNFGTTTSTDLEIQIFKYVEHPMLYTNLVVNGSGDEGLDGWQTDTSIKTSDYFTTGLLETRNLGSFNVDLTKPLEVTYPQQVFRFSKTTNWSSLPTVFNRIVNNDNINAPDFKWARSIPAALVLNERKTETSLATFFPDPSWIDTYNRNNTGNLTIPLQREIENSNAYFTRDNIRFSKFGDKSVSRAVQTIDLTDAADLIDGNVYGIDSVVGQFFAYVGIGLSRYKFNIPYESGNTQTNWFIIDTTVYEDIGEDFATRGPTSIFYPEGGVDESKPIELIPIADDITTINIRYLDGNDDLISEKNIDGPTAEDIFAVKEKFYIPKFLETPMTKGIPYRAAESYDLYDIDAIYNAMSAFQTADSWTLASGDGRVDARTDKWYDEINNDIWIAVLGILSQNPDNADSDYDTTKVRDTDFYDYYYRRVAEEVAFDNKDQDEDSRASSDANLDAGNIYYFQYMIFANFRTAAEFNTWRFDMLANNDGYQRDDDGVSQRDAYKIQQRFIIFEKFLQLAEQNKTRITDNLRYRNPINIYNQTYTKVDRIGYLMDRNLKWINDNLESSQYPLKSDPGAAAFFAINDNNTIPKGTRKVQLSFEFKHTSEIQDDQSPEINNWDKQELYIDLFGQVGQDKNIGLKYGEPRCGITSMKYVLFANKLTVNTNYNSYNIPPKNVWYTEKEKLKQNIHDSTLDLVVNITTVDGLQPLPVSQPVTQNELNTPTEPGRPSTTGLQQQQSERN